MDVRFTFHTSNCWWHLAQLCCARAPFELTDVTDGVTALVIGKTADLTDRNFVCHCFVDIGSGAR